MSQEKRWSEKSIQRRKSIVKEELDQLEAAQGPQAKAEWISSRIKALEEAASSDQLLALYVYLLSSLVHHLRYQHLSETRIKKTLQLAHSILLAQGIREGVSRLSHLHGELQYMTSQVERQKGQHWSAAWHQFLGDQVSRIQGAGGE